MCLLGGRGAPIQQIVHVNDAMLSTRHGPIWESKKGSGLNGPHKTSLQAELTDISCAHIERMNVSESADPFWGRGVKI